ncbi:uncharacterized protein Z520_01120 [Fonsecaea multimorphosa CBS 102226]|uniref:Uncharacterized protein n=1 Tax=Fonsecaea multimorphosa CBS 102226 TaxID=1442371 RepID=A0A0D2KGR1_9EURO|nr:uncharacterized protein Z520_01120 [Fonsecaea multimorphosa CBS 102226]KIY02655.1 hypothetical protein Z520_01120 [Fonsecaea multimorphosa CBS 102226]OAL31518.1 hypothetical protein AYO22_01110 [Fonsecaea multimorphosa]
MGRGSLVLKRATESLLFVELELERGRKRSQDLEFELVEQARDPEPVLDHDPAKELDMALAVALETAPVHKGDMEVAGHPQRNFAPKHSAPSQTGDRIDMERNTEHELDRELVMDSQPGFPEDDMCPLHGMVQEWDCAVEGSFEVDFDNPAKSDMGLLGLTHDTVVGMKLDQSMELEGCLEVLYSMCSPEQVAVLTSKRLPHPEHVAEYVESQC